MADVQTQNESSSNGVKELIMKNKVIVVVVVVLLLVVVYFLMKKGEKFTNFALNMAAAENPDPVLFKYTGRLRAPTGRTQYDNLYENKLLYNQSVAKRLEGHAAFEPRVAPPFPAIVPNAENGFQFAARNDVMRGSELGWAEARKRLRAEKGPDAIITRAQIEAAALAAENNAATAAVGDNAAEAPGQDDLAEHMSGRY